MTHLAQSVHKAERLLLAHVAAQHACVCAGGTWMTHAAFQNAVACDHGKRADEGGHQHLLIASMPDDQSAAVPVLRPIVIGHRGPRKKR